MSKVVSNALARLERSLGLEAVDPAEDEAAKEWVPPEQALRHQLPLLQLGATWPVKPEWFDRRRAEVERRYPSGGFWRKRSLVEDDLPRRNLAEELLESLRAKSAITRALDANPGMRARLDAQRRARLMRWLPPDNPLQSLLAADEAAAPVVDEHNLMPLRLPVELDLGRASYGIVEINPPDTERAS